MRYAVLATAAVAGVILGAVFFFLSSQDRQNGPPSEDSGTPHVARPPDDAAQQIEVALPSSPAQSSSSGEMPGRAATYDPTVMIRAKRVSPRIVFETEKRSEPWASTYEERLREALAAELPSVSKDVSVTTLECREGCCAAVISGPVQVMSDDLLINYPVMAMADLVGVEGPDVQAGGMSNLSYVLCFTPAHRDLEEYGDWLPGNLARTRARIEEALGRQSDAN